VALEVEQTPLRDIAQLLDLERPQRIPAALEVFDAIELGARVDCRPLFPELPVCFAVPIHDSESRVLEDPERRC
jgi:hypothetical protein